MSKGEQQPPRDPEAKKPAPPKKPENIDKPGLTDEQLGKVTGGSNTYEPQRK